MSNREDTAILQDILESIERILSYTEGGTGSVLAFGIRN